MIAGCYSTLLSNAQTSLSGRGQLSTFAVASNSLNDAAFTCSRVHVTRRVLFCFRPVRLLSAMSSDGYFEGDDFDPSLLNELDAIEARHFSPSRNTTQPAHIDPPATPLVSTRAAPLARADTSDFFDDSFAIDDAEFQRLDTFIEDAYQGKAGPVAGPSTVSRSASKVQMTLFGDVLPQEASSSKAKATPSRGLTKQPSVKRSQFGQQAPKTKTWDRTAFAKSGWKKQPKGKGKDKGKGKGSFDGDEDDVEDEEEADFEQFPAPFVSLGPPPPMKLEADLLEAKHWIYPLNKPKRDYQFNIVKHSLFENTLVALPTGLGKTFVAGVVMLNCMSVFLSRFCTSLTRYVVYRWFPEGKVIFVAPTKPLVAQQVDACHKSCGIPGRDAAELTGEIQRGRRAKLVSASSHLRKISHLTFHDSGRRRGYFS